LFISAVCIRKTIGDVIRYIGPNHRGGRILVIGSDGTTNRSFA
jgi:hypothetical protein